MTLRVRGQHPAGMRWFVCCLIALFAAADASAESDGFRMADLQWKHRVLLVFSPSQVDLRFQGQYEEWKRALAGMEERDLLWMPLVTGESAKAAGRDISPKAQEALRREFGIGRDDFAVLLVGRDGGVKLRQREPVDALRLFALIDSMPMRRQEIRERRGRNP